MRAILLKDGKFEEVEIEKFEDYYKFLECETFDIQTTTIFSKQVSMYIDDEGLFKKGNIAYNSPFFHSPLCGNILFLGGADKDGKTLPLDGNITLNLLNNYVKFYGIVK